MKKYLKFLFVALFATMTLSLASCKDDNDEPSTDTIEGSWKVENPVADLMSSNQFMQFRSDGTFYEVIEYTEDMSFFGTVYQKGTWSLSGKNLNISVKNPFKVKKVSSKELIIEEMGIELKCIRVSDETVNELLKKAKPM